MKHRIKTTSRGGFFIYLSAMLTLSRIILVALLFVLSRNVHSQSMQEEFYDQWARQDTSGMFGFLKEWKLTEPYNPDVYVGFFNYYAIQTFEEDSLLMSSMPIDSGEYKSSVDTIEGTPSEWVKIMVINDSILDIAFAWVEEGIQRFPDRLDLRMGKVYLAIETDRFYEVSASLQETLEMGDSINHAWKWMQEEILDDGRDFMYSSVQGHLFSLFEKEDSTALEVIREISILTVDDDKQEYLSVTNLATVAMIQERYSAAQDWLKRANEIHGNDPVILSNLGFCTWKLGDMKRAKKYYQRAIETSDEASKATYLRQLELIDEQNND